MHNTQINRATGAAGRRPAQAATALAAALFLLGCASTAPVPTTELALSAAAINTAVTAGAPELAPAEMRSARDKLERAKAAVTAEDNTLARRLAEQSLAEAQLAAAKAQSSKARNAAAELQASIRVLREEINRQARP